jgi:hypothetical protein
MTVDAEHTRQLLEARADSLKSEVQRQDWEGCTVREIALDVLAILDDAGVPDASPSNVTCAICRQRCAARTAHLHQGQWIGDECCWDERLRSSE